jgi:phage anti-repressor protein
MVGCKKSNLKKKLTDDFIENIDYNIERKSGATHVEIIKITPDCFKHLCMMSQTKKAKEVRLYFLNIEKIIRQYHQEIQNKMEKKLALVKYNQKPKVKFGIKGKVYVFQALNTEDTLYKLGNSKDLETRLKTYNTGLANDLQILFELEVNDIEMVEDCAKAFLKRYQYRKRKEVYETNLEIVSGMLEKCDIFSKSIEKFFESHKK